MRFIKFVQSGDYTKARNNGMEKYVYSFGITRDGDYTILTSTGFPSPGWFIPKRYATSFNLELILE